MPYRLLNALGEMILSDAPGRLGGNRRSKVYGRLDCKTAARYLAKGTYQKNRVFFADEATAKAAGYRPCGRCMRQSKQQSINELTA
jgi:methylphosphotriester-DNA--protein-cysteine methyltransferase